MGCINQRHQVVSPSSYRRSSLCIDLKSLFSNKIETLVSDFEKYLEEKITMNNPKTLIKFNEIINQGIRRSEMKFEEYVQKYSDRPECKIQVNFFKYYLKSSCKAKEGIFHNKNSLNSCKYIFSLAFDNLKKIEKGELTEKKALENYKENIKGAYMIKGLQIFHNLLELPRQERRKFLKNVEELEESNLKKYQLQLFAIDNDWNFTSIINQARLPMENENLDDSLVSVFDNNDKSKLRIQRNSVCHSLSNY